MALMKCPECGHDVSDQAIKCPNCGFGISNGKEKDTIQTNQQEKSEWVKANPQIPPVTPEKARKKSQGCLVAVIVFLMICVLASKCGSSDDKKADESTMNSNLAVETEKTIENANDKKTNIEDFSFNIVENKINITSYKGTNETLFISSSYEIDGEKFKTDLSNFQVGSGVKRVIFANGIKKLKVSVFNGSDVEQVYIPKSIKLIYDYTLSYLHSETDNKIQIYYAGTKKQWKKVFKKYKRKKMSETKNAKEKGEALADKLNEMIGSEYDAEKFEYFFNSKPDDIK